MPRPGLVAWSGDGSRVISFAARLAQCGTKGALGLSAVVMPLVIFIPHIAVSWAIVAFSVAYFGQQSWSTLIMVLPTICCRAEWCDPLRLIGFGGAMGGIAFGQLVGYLLDHGLGYGIVFALAGCFT